VAGGSGPHVYFQLATTHAILRHNGVDIGATDLILPHGRGWQYERRNKRAVVASLESGSLGKSWPKEELEIAKSLEARRYFELRCIGNNVI
jgi:hypothetical protein